MGSMKESRGARRWPRVRCQRSEAGGNKSKNEVEFGLGYCETHLQSAPDVGPQHDKHTEDAHDCGDAHRHKSSTDYVGIITPPFVLLPLPFSHFACIPISIVVFMSPFQASPRVEPQPRVFREVDRADIDSAQSKRYKMG